MRKQNLVGKVGLFALLVALAALTEPPYVAPGSAQSANPRYGRWKLKSDAAPPSSNIMTYEPFDGKGMKITIDAVNRDGVKFQGTGEEVSSPARLFPDLPHRQAKRLAAGERIVGDD